MQAIPLTEFIKHLVELVGDEKTVRVAGERDGRIRVFVAGWATPGFPSATVELAASLGIAYVEPDGHGFHKGYFRC